MSMNINKKSYEKLIKEDLDFINKHCPDSPELDHVKLIVCNSVDWYYPDKNTSSVLKRIGNSIDWGCSDKKLSFILKRIDNRLIAELKRLENEGKSFFTCEEISGVINNIIKEERLRKEKRNGQ